MKAIKTIFLGPTNFRGSRVKATDEDGHSVTLSWEPALNADENHRAAARALCDKMKWAGRMHTGSLAKCYVHVFEGRE